MDRGPWMGVRRMSSLDFCDVVCSRARGGEGKGRQAPSAKPVWLHSCANTKGRSALRNWRLQLWIIAGKRHWYRVAWLRRAFRSPWYHTTAFRMKGGAVVRRVAVQRPTRESGNTRSEGEQKDGPGRGEARENTGYAGTQGGVGRAEAPNHADREGKHTIGFRGF